MNLPTFLKWAGGKRKLLKQISRFFPEKIDSYYEPFLGGGSVFFYIKKKYKPSHCHLSDINLDLVNTYIDVRDNPKKLIRHLAHFKNKDSESFYYLTRKKFNQHKFKGIRRSAVFIYLNKTCFNGLYRVNSKNEFNVPFGKHLNSEIFNRDTIMEASSLLQGATITNEDYFSIASKIKPNDFVYLDPCYDPLKKSSFANYTPKRFTTEDRQRLKKFIRIISEKGAIVRLSNNDIPEIRESYSDFNIHLILAPRSINSKGNLRGEIKELLICTG